MKRRPPRIETTSELRALKAQEYLQHWLRNLRMDFYQGATAKDQPAKDKAFFQQRHQLIQALTYPASFLSERGVYLPGDRINQIMRVLVEDIKTHGNTGAIKHFGVYFLQVVQSHFKKNDETYYEEGKTAAARSVNSMKLGDIFKGMPDSDDGEKPHTFTEELAAFQKLTRSGPKKGQKQAKTANKSAQAELF